MAGMLGLSISTEKTGEKRRCKIGLLTIYVKLWKIDGQKQTHIKGKSFKIEYPEDVWEPANWVVNTINELLEKEGE